MFKLSIAVDLYNADEEQVLTFETQLANKRWVKLPGPANSFGTLVQGSASDSAMVETAEEDVTQSAEFAGIYDWDGVCLLSAPPSEDDPQHTFKNLFVRSDACSLMDPT